jgi:hypothetical protein
MIGPRKAWRILLAALLLGAELAAVARDAPAPADLGQALYEGTLPGYTSRVRNARDAAVQLPAASAACVSCHRPSGLGSFEGGLAVPPVAGKLLFNPLDAATTHRYAWTSLLRVRPAYTEASLRDLLASGHTPDGLVLSPVMPRYDFSAAEVVALARHLNTLSSSLAPGVTDTSVTFATITTPEVSAAQVSELLATLNRFVAHKNANTRGENARRSSAVRNEQSMYRRHRTWQLRHWALSGAPDTWAAQLNRLYEREPVFAVLSGVGEQTWEPVHRFCATQRVPCLLPTVALPPQDEDFYSVYLSRALIGQAQAAARHLLEQPQLPAEVLVLQGESRAEQAQAQAIAATLTHELGDAAGRVRVAREWRAGATLVSALAPGQIQQRMSGAPGGALGGAPGGATLLALSGVAGIDDAPRVAAPPAPADRSAAWGTGSAWVTDQLHGAPAQLQLQRAHNWLRANALLHGSGPVSRNALLAATVAVESLMHVDEQFSREYCIEKLEHTLENMPPLTAYPRLAIGPRQRFAAKQVMVVPMGLARPLARE